MTASARSKIGPVSALAVLALTVAVAPTVMANQPRAGSEEATAGRLVEFRLRLTSSVPGSPTGLELYAAARGEGKPPPLRSLVYRAPRGTRFDTRAVTECTASDEQFHALGTEACPDDSELAIGSFSSISGFGPPIDPLNADVHVFNGPDQLIEVITFPDSSASPVIDRLTISGSTLTAHPPQAPGGPPDGEMAVKSIEYAIAATTGSGRSLITTPPKCPATARWTSSATFGFANGDSETVSSTMACERPDSLRLSVRPSRVPVGEAVDLRYRIRSDAVRCVARAVLLLRGQELPVDGDGRASLTRRFRRPGVRRADVSSPGCGEASARFEVLPSRGG